MNPSDFKKVLRIRINEQLDEYISVMEDMFDEDYWKGFRSIGEGIRAFADNLVEKYEASKILEEEDDKFNEPPDDELQKWPDESPNLKWVINWKGVDKPPSAPMNTEVIEAPTKTHAQVLFNRAHAHEACEILSIRREHE